MELSPIVTSISNVSECGEHFKIAVSFFGPGEMTLEIKKHDGLKIQEGDGISCFVSLEGNALKLNENIELFRDGMLYASAKLDL